MEVSITIRWEMKNKTYMATTITPVEWNFPFPNSKVDTMTIEDDVNWEFVAFGENHPTKENAKETMLGQTFEFKWVSYYMENFRITATLLFGDGFD